MRNSGFLRTILGSVVVLTIVFVGCGSAQGAEAPGADSEQIDIIEISTEAHTLPEELTFRARVTALNPSEQTTINWRYGGEAQGGKVHSGVLGKDLEIGQWTDPVPVISLCEGRFPPSFHGRRWFLTFTVGKGGTRGVEMEFEFSYKGEVIKTFREAGPDGRTVGIVVPHYLLRGGNQPDHPDFVEQLGGLLSYAQRRAKSLEDLPWSGWPLPKLYPIVSDVSGFGESGYGIRYSNKEITETECATLRQLGANSLRAAPRYLKELSDRREGIGKEFARLRITHSTGFAVPSYRKGRENHPEAGCPFGSLVPELTTSGVIRSVEDNLKVPVDEVWALTIDEIGTVIDRTPEGKLHLNTCPRCRAAYQTYLQSLGVTLEQLGKTSWDEVRPHWAAKGEGLPPLIDWYYTRKFNNYATAKMFVALKDAFAQENSRKRKALARGQTDTPAAKQPWIYSFALRGNTFLMKGHSLDFFDFYRYADNAFVYETSNMGPQIWSWDSYLCDVGRIVSQRMDKRFGIYVKPHRGAPLQRALSATARNVRMIYWYTYGPEYFKGDSFADRPDALKLASKAAHLIGKTEHVLYGSSWVRPPEVAIVKPRATEILASPAANAAWENAKWVYTALQHAHVPVDPLDEVMLATDDLSRYRIIYVNGSHIPRNCAKALTRYVENGGTLWTSGWGCARDEGGKPLESLAKLMGLTERSEPEIWYSVNRYAATALQRFDNASDKLADVPEGAKITKTGLFGGSFTPVIGREVLRPSSNAEVLATYADGGAAAIRHKYGKGQVYVVGFFPGLEYSATVRRQRFNMARDFDEQIRSFVTKPALGLVKPPLDVSVPTVEAVLVKNDKTGKRAVTLMNWAYRVSGLRVYSDNTSSRPIVSIIKHNDVKITIRDAGKVEKVTSAVLDKSLPIKTRGNDITVILPELEEGDVLLLE